MVVRVRSATVTAAMGRLIEGGGERHRGAKHSTIHKKNVRRAVTRRAYRVLGQDRATIGRQIYLRNPAGGAEAAIPKRSGRAAVWMQISPLEPLGICSSFVKGREGQR